MTAQSLFSHVVRMGHVKGETLNDTCFKKILTWSFQASSELKLWVGTDRLKQTFFTKGFLYLFSLSSVILSLTQKLI